MSYVGKSLRIMSGTKEALYKSGLVFFLIISITSILFFLFSYKIHPILHSAATKVGIELNRLIRVSSLLGHILGYKGYPCAPSWAKFLSG